MKSKPGEHVAFTVCGAERILLVTGNPSGDADALDVACDKAGIHRMDIVLSDSMTPLEHFEAGTLLVTDADVRHDPRFSGFNTGYVRLERNEGPPVLSLTPEDLVQVMERGKILELDLQHATTEQNRLRGECAALQEQLNGTVRMERSPAEFRREKDHPSTILWGLLFLLFGTSCLFGGATLFLLLSGH
jgi:hypothetical protein